MQNFTRTNFEHLEKVRNRSIRVARSCKDLRDRYDEREGKDKIHECNITVQGIYVLLRLNYVILML